MLIFAERSPTARALLERLRAAGLEVFTARRGTRYQQVGPDTYAITPGSTDDAARLLATLRDAGRLPRRIVFAWPLEDPSLVPDHLRPDLSVLMDPTYGLSPAQLEEGKQLAHGALLRLRERPTEAVRALPLDELRALLAFVTGGGASLK